MSKKQEWIAPLISSGAQFLLGRLLDRMTPSEQGTKTVADEAGTSDIERINGIELQPGDILSAVRAGGLYQHFAVYIGDGRVIHYAAETGDFNGRISIHEADIATFRGDADFVYVLDFPQDGIASAAGLSNLPAMTNPSEESPIFDVLRSANYHLYSPEETVARARSRIGEEKYSLPFNNCEHFAIWCRTGVAESHQVNVWMTRLAKWAEDALMRGREPKPGGEEPNTADAAQ